MFDRLTEFFTKNGHKKNNEKFLILVIEDNPIDRRLIEKILRKQGYRLHLASEGKTGLQLAESQKPDLVLLDYDLPGMTGAEICEELKSNDLTKNIPVVFLTGSDTARSIIECFDLDAENYFAKPLNPRFLTSQVDLILKEHA